MPRPETKAVLLDLSAKNRAKLIEFIRGLPDDQKRRSFEHAELNDRDKTIADVVCHLHEWHVMMLGWYKVGMSGQKPSIPAPGITWQTLPVLNRQIHERYTGTSLDDAVAWFDTSHQELMVVIASHSDDELFTKKRYSWTGTTSLGAYLISATSSHYDWALKTIKGAVNPKRGQS